MTRKKSELVSGINSFVSARLTNDAFLMESAAQRLQAFLDSLDFAPEGADAEEESVDDEG